VIVSKRDYYETLGVDRSVSESDLKKAYRKLAMECHPDRNPDDPAAEERFKEVSEAYAVLSDSDKRARYNQFGHAGVSGPGGGGHPGAAGFEDLGNFGDLFSDLFGDMFGGAGGRGGSRRGRGQRGADLRYNLEISLDDVLNGCEPNLKIPKMRRCEPCEGSGAAEGSTPSRCGQCEGTGQLVFQQGFFRVNRPCDACGGAGEVISNPCTSCRGAGRTEGQQTIRVKVPAGVEEGARLRVSGEGEAGIAGGPSGDLYVVMVLKEHLLFERDGTDIHIEVPVPFVQAALGAEVEVPTLEGTVNLQIPEGTQSGRVLRLRSKGLPPLQPRMEHEQLMKMRGDLYVRVFVEVPTKLNSRQRELLEEFAEQSGHEVSPATKGFMDKIRDFF
jgi:molecular chaperone DnaJ